MKNLFVPLILLAIFMTDSFAADHPVKEPNVAGGFYPGENRALSRSVDEFLKNVPSEDLAGEVAVIISPHAGYMYSGQVAAYGFKAAGGQPIKTVIILAPSHYFPFSGASVWPKGSFRTPLGEVSVDEELAAVILSADKRIINEPAVFEKEHSLETQLPFIQKTFPGAKIVPVIMGQPDLDFSKKLADILFETVGNRKDVLINVSSDLSHFHPDDKARLIDKRGLDAIENLDPVRFWNGHAAGEMEVDAFHAVTAAMLYAKRSGVSKARVIRYATSGDVTGDKDRVVGYASVLFTRPSTESAAATFTHAQQQRLLSVARSTIEAIIKNGRAPEVQEADPRLLREEGAFVTLKKQGHLRGCIGNILGNGPLVQTVRRMAIAAATEDPRFDRVSPDELKDIDIEISVLSVPREIRDVNEIVMGKHGVIVNNGGRGGVFLPQVATETGWDRETFLGQLCSQKAGLPSDCWKDPATRLEIFSAEIISEKK